MKKRIFAGAAAVAAASLALTGCASGVDPQDVATDFGVTADTITLGVLTDVSKIYTATAGPMVAGMQIYADEVNDGGGLCGRQLVLDVQDHASDSALATQLFQGMQDNVLGFGSILGSPQQDALKEFVVNSEMTAVVAGWSSTVLDTPNYVIAGSTYPIETINGLSWLQDEGMIKKGDTIGYINVPGPFGADARSGAQFFADENGYTLVGPEITGKETDLAAQVAQLKDAGVTAVWVTSGPGSFNQAATAMKAAGMNIPLMTNTPGYAGFQIAADAPAADFILANAHVASSLLPFGAESSPTAVAVAEFFDLNYASDKVKQDANVNYGYAQIAIFGQAIEAGCKAGDLTRAGIQTALGTLTSVDTGVVVPLNYSDRSVSPSTETYILMPNADAAGASSLEASPGTSETAMAFQGVK